jgi:hypothetical protein
VWWPPARGVVVYVHGRLAIVDRELLETMSCECYAKITSELERVRGLLLKRVERGRRLELISARCAALTRSGCRGRGTCQCPAPGPSR